jgi:hypothetical protein
MEVKKDLRLEKCIQTKEKTGRLGPADMFVQMRVIEWKIKGLI